MTPGGALLHWVGLVLGTFVSEDLTCVTAGVLVRDRVIGHASALSGCLVGIYLGDAGIWLLGRIGARTMSTGGFMSRRLRRLVPEARLKRAVESLDRHMPLAILASRFMPGARLPIYFAAGALGRRPGVFFVVSLCAAILWTPLIVIGSYRGSSLIPSGLPSPAAVVGGIALLAAIRCGWRLARLGLTPVGRARLVARLSRLWRWEFWPSWVFYAPVIPWILLLALRHRGFGAIGSAIPGIPQGGFVGESKHAILRKLPRERCVPGRLIPPGGTEERLALLGRAMRRGGWNWPIVLKPDAGERGAGVRIIRDGGQARDYLASYAPDVLAQRYDPGPCEAGIFYYRIPGEDRGRIFSITDKVFPRVTGDGKATLEDLIWRHPRYRMQADRFLVRHRERLGMVLPAGESFQLAQAGNHVQGTMFRDGRHLLTPQLERAVDACVRGFTGFYFGRFDVRFDSSEALKRGAFRILELNGATSESTNLYDPDGRLIDAYRTLYRQWALLFRIGSLNRHAGEGTSLRSLVATAWVHFRRCRPSPIAD